ncbi:MAG: hypothetical protein FWD69_10725 [Polyangiaceae bacterium]|nr:hypothetical protein [Polyangiaceae bacterium]
MTAMPVSRTLVLALSLTIAVASGSLSCDRESSRTEEVTAGVRLGMSPRDVREHFQGGGDGSWQTTIGSGTDRVIDWRAQSDAARFTQARFEFHLGMLVAVRAHTRDASASENIVLTPKTVTLRSPASDGGTDVTVLARDCPTHHDEAEALAAKKSR